MSAETNFGFTYHSHMIPPYKPERILMLGVDESRVLKLIRLVYGKSNQVIGVDREFVQSEVCDFINVRDAFDWVRKTEALLFDYVAIDLWNGQKVCEFIYEKSFMQGIKNLAEKMVCMNIPHADLDRCAEYVEHGFNYLRHDVVYGNAIVWWGLK